MKNNLKKLVAGLSASLVFLGNNVYASEGFLTFNGINLGVIIGAVLIALVLFLGFKMDKSEEKNEEFFEKQDNNTHKSLDDLPSDYTAIKEDMPYEEEDNELYEFEDTPKEKNTEGFSKETNVEEGDAISYSIGIDEPQTPIGVVPPAGFDTGVQTESTYDDPDLNSYSSTSTSSLDDLPNTTSSLDDLPNSVSDETMVVPNMNNSVEEEYTSAEAPEEFTGFGSSDVNESTGFSNSTDTETTSFGINEPENNVNYTSFDASSSTLEDEVSKLDDLDSSSDLDELDSTDNSKKDDDSDNTTSEELVVPEDEVASFSFDTDLVQDDEEEEALPEEPVKEELDEPVQEDVETSSFSDKEEVKEEPKSFEFSSSEDAKEESPEEDSDAFVTAEEPEDLEQVSDDDEIIGEVDEGEDLFDILDSSNTIEEDDNYDLSGLNNEIDGLDDLDDNIDEDKVSKELNDFKSKVADTDGFTHESSSDTEDDSDNERDPDTLTGFGDSSDNSEDTDSLKIDGDSLVDNGFLDQMEANMKKDQEDRQKGKK